MPINYQDYPANWKSEIRPRILARANDKCEECGVSNGSALLKGTHKVVLTLHHKDGQLIDHSDSNLIALCQKCHLNKHRRR
jgi:5-methylcytosine-specific restriction endonuclease McrA